MVKARWCLFYYKLMFKFLYKGFRELEYMRLFIFLSEGGRVTNLRQCFNQRRPIAFEIKGYTHLIRDFEFNNIVRTIQI